MTQSRAHRDSDASLTSLETEREAGRNREDPDPITKLKQREEGVDEVSLPSGSMSPLGFLLLSTN